MAQAAPVNGNGQTFCIRKRQSARVHQRVTHHFWRTWTAYVPFANQHLQFLVSAFLIRTRLPTRRQVMNLLELKQSWENIQIRLNSS